MRTFQIFPVIAAAALLAACGGGEAEQAGEGVSVDEALAEARGAEQMRPGEYETSVEMLDIQVPGMPEAEVAKMKQFMSGMTAQTSTFCLTPEEAAQGPEQMVQEMAKADCTFNTFDVGGGKMRADMECRNEDGIAGRYVMDGEMTAESSTMRMEVEQAMPGMAGAERANIEMRITSRRIGECS